MGGFRSLRRKRSSGINYIGSNGPPWLATVSAQSGVDGHAFPAEPTGSLTRTPRTEYITNMNDTSTTDGGTDPERSDRTRQLSYERDRGESPSEAVIEAVSDHTGTDPLELDPLYHVIDPDALDGVFETAPEDGVDAEVSIRYNGCTVTVTHDEVRVRDAEE